MRGRTEYCSVLLDDNQRKPICRLWLKRSQKYLGLFDEQKHEERVQIGQIDDIFEYADQLKSAVGYYDEGESPNHAR